MTAGALTLWTFLALQQTTPHPLSKYALRDTVSTEFYKGLRGPEFDRAQIAFDRQNYREALNIFLELFRANKDPAALFLAGNCHYHLGDADAAIRSYRQAIAEGLQKMPDVHYNLANAYYEKFRRKEAIQEFEIVLELTKGEDPAAHYGLGIILDGEGRHDDAIAHYLRTVELTNDGEPLARQHLGVCYFTKRDFPAAVRELGIYVRQVPDDPGGFLNFGIALRYAGQLEQAIEQLHLAIDRSGDQIPSAHYQLARIFGERREYELALRHFAIALDRGLKSPKTEAEYEALKKQAARP